MRKRQRSQSLKAGKNHCQVTTSEISRKVAKTQIQKVFPNISKVKIKLLRTINTIKTTKVERDASLQ